MQYNNNVIMDETFGPSSDISKKLHDYSLLDIITDTKRDAFMHRMNQTHVLHITITKNNACITFRRISETLICVEFRGTGTVRIRAIRVFDPIIPRRIALAMALHPRLGERSPLALLPPDATRIINASVW